MKRLLACSLLSLAMVASSRAAEPAQSDSFLNLVKVGQKIAFNGSTIQIYTPAQYASHVKQEQEAAQRDAEARKKYESVVKKYTEIREKMRTASPEDREELQEEYNKIREEMQKLSPARRGVPAAIRGGFGGRPDDDARRAALIEAMARSRGTRGSSRSSRSVTRFYDVVKIGGDYIGLKQGQTITYIPASRISSITVQLDAPQSKPTPPNPLSNEK